MTDCVSDATLLWNPPSVKTWFAALPVTSYLDNLKVQGSGTVSWKDNDYMTGLKRLLDFFLKDGDRLGWGGLSGNCIISGHRNFTAWAPVVMQLESPNICPAACAKAEIPLLHICKAYLHLWCSFVLQIVSMKMLVKANRTVPAAFWKRPIFGKFDQCETLTEKIWQSTRDKDEMWNFIFHLLPI